MKTFKQKVKEYLENEPRFRERSNKDRGIINMLIIKYPMISSIRKETFISIVQDYSTMDRYWRQILDENEGLRGRDYVDKKRLVQEKQIELGYEVGYNRDMKSLRKINAD
jgi:hypothetical protein